MSTSRGAPLKPKRGEIWLVHFDPTVGSEVRKCRPTVVVGVDAVGRLPLRIVVPVTEWKGHYASFVWFTKLDPTGASGLSKTSGADAFQVKSVSLDRFRKRLGLVNPGQLKNIVDAIALCIGA